MLSRNPQYSVKMVREVKICVLPSLVIWSKEVLFKESLGDIEFHRTDYSATDHSDK